MAELCELVEDAFLGLDMIPESWEAYPDLKCPLSTPEKLEFFDNYFRNLSKYFKIGNAATYIFNSITTNLVLHWFYTFIHCHPYAESGGKAFGGKAFGGEAATQHECDDFTNTVCELMELLGFTLKPGES